MNRFLLLSAALAAGPALAADAPPPPVRSWMPPPTVWKDAQQPMPVAQTPAPIPGVPSPAAQAPPKAQDVPLGAPNAVPRMPSVPTPAPAPQPAPQLAPQPAPQTGAATAPLYDLLSAPLPTSPSVPAYQYTHAVFPESVLTAPTQACAECGPAARSSCLARLGSWLAFQPGPPVLPVCAPNRYQAPLRDYFPCVGGAGCGANGCGAAGCNRGLGAGGYPASAGVSPLGGVGLAAPARPAAGSRLANLGSGLGNLRGLVTPAGHGNMSDSSGGGGGVLGPVAGGCGTPGLIQGGPLAGLHFDGGCGSDGCVAIKHKGLGAFDGPSEGAPVTGPTCVGTQAVGVPLPASCVGSPAGYTGCYAGCDTVGSACRQGAGGRLMGLVFGTCRGGCSQVAEGGNGFAPTSVVPVVTGYARPQVGNYRYADPLNRVVGPTVGQPELGQPRVDGIGPPVIQSGHADPSRPFTRQ